MRRILSSILHFIVESIATLVDDDNERRERLARHAKQQQQNRKP
jgi:hypothetical protein